MSRRERAAEDAERECLVDELDLAGMVGNMHFRMGLLASERRDVETQERLWEMVPFLKALGRLAVEHPGRARELWAEALEEPMPFGMPPVGMPRVKAGS